MLVDIGIERHIGFLKSGSWDKWGKLETSQEKMDKFLGIYNNSITPLGKISK